MIPYSRRMYRETAVMIDHMGKVVQGSYRVDERTITVSWHRYRMVRELSHIPASTLAKMMLREMVTQNSAATQPG